MLSTEQKKFYQNNGYLILEDHLPAEWVQRCVDEVDRFRQMASGVEKSNDLLDLEDTHTPENPRLRRIKSPNENSPVFNELLHSSYILDPVKDLLGPNLRLHTSKLNMKSAGYGAAVEWHQDFAFYPHTNKGVLAVGVGLNDMGVDNGPMMVIPESHKGPIYDHHSDGRFAGAIDLEKNDIDLKKAVPCIGPKGTITIHHGICLHGSDINRSNQDRMLLLYEITAADAFPIMGSMTSFTSIEDYNQRMLCGEPTIEPRLEATPVRLPLPRRDNYGSIYEVQKELKNPLYEKETL